MTDDEPISVPVSSAMTELHLITTELTKLAAAASTLTTCIALQQRKLFVIHRILSEAGL